MKTKIILLITILLILSGMEQVNAQDYFQDTVWMRKTDQSEGFYMVKFSDNDSIIVGHGYDNVLFFDSFTGHEVQRITGSNEVFFIYDDKKFIRLNDEGSKIEIFNIPNYQVVDTLEHDGIKIYPLSALSYNKRYFVSIVQGGIRVWDLSTKKILKTKFFLVEENLTEFNIDQIKFTCDDNRLICTEYKVYKDPQNPNNPYSTLNHTIYDFNTLDSIDAFLGMTYFRISNSCTNIAFKRGDPIYGVEVYDFNTKELLWKLPINGPSLTGIEFSPDDKYLVTANGPSANNMQIWDLSTGKSKYKYEGSSFMNFDISHDGKYIVWTSGEWIVNYFARWEGATVEGVGKNPIIIYPNPTNEMVSIEFEQLLLENTTVNLNDINGVLIRNLFNNFLETGQQSLNFNVSDLANGSYYITVNNQHLSLFFKLIINR